MEITMCVKSGGYGPPAAGRSAAPPSSSYGAPFTKHGGRGGGAGGYGRGAQSSGYYKKNFGPGKYEFKYDVQDYQSGNDFGHMESRDGNLTVGRYYVLLPDGRKQIVDYEADQNGYRPTVRYEQVYNGAGNGFGGGAGGGYYKNAQAGGFGGYQ